jgi:hypothetical protein
MGSVPSGMLHHRPALALSSAGSGAAAAAHAVKVSQPAVVLPLYTDGRDLTRFAYAVYLLNKDVELVLQVRQLRTWMYSALGPKACMWGWLEASCCMYML